MSKVLLALGLLPLIVFSLPAQSVDPAWLSALQWRMIGPHRGGRTVGAVGVPQQPNVFYIGVNNGGVWRTDDFGRTWTPIFDDQPTGSIGDVVVAPSDPNTIYVATGEGIQRPDLSVGDGVYKSTDGGRTWVNTGLHDGLQIGGLAIDPKNPNRVFAAVLGHPYGPNPERGVFRTLDGGKSWEKILYRDENTGAAQVAIDPQNPDIVYADLWENRLAPWENGEWHGEGSGLWKSTDGGNTWRPLTKGLPTPAQGLGRIGFCVAPSAPNRMYASVDAGELGGIYRSEDAGASWNRVNADGRLWGRGDDFAEVRCDPKNPDIVYSANVVTWKSTDGGRQWLAFRGAPGGDDYHRIWINPENPDIILIASDQGAIITVNGGKTFSSWYNQPTAQFYHVSTDNAFPYNVYGGQQESGSVGIASRGNDGQITFREWHPVGAQEYGYVAADPLDPNIIYGGKLSKYDKRTGQTQDIRPEVLRGGNYRFIRTAPVLFSPIDPHVLYFAGNVLFKTRDGGHSWKIISPDLSRETYPDLPACIGKYQTEQLKTMPRRGVIYTIAPSPLDSNLIWAGTDDGLIHVTRDGGKNWANVTPPSVTPWSKVSLMDASHTDPNKAYAAINRIRCDDLHPHILRTSDGGRTWLEITSGLPDNEPINTVREDPRQPGLLFAGSERSVYVSFDDGDHWQSLRLNMPATSIRDLVIKDDDLVVGTHGRSFWILDNISPLREMLKWQQTAANVILFTPQTATRVRWNLNTDTPLPQEEPAGQNPPDGAIIDYFLRDKAPGVVKLEILNPSGTVVRTYTSADRAPDVDGVNIPLYWVRPPQILSGAAGAHRFCWDMRYDPVPGAPANFPISAIYNNTAPDPSAPWVMPGEYEVRLTVNGQTFTKPVQVRMDPRVQTSPDDLQLQHDLAVKCYANRKVCRTNLSAVAALRQQIAKQKGGAKGRLSSDLDAFDRQLRDFENNPQGTGFKDFARLERENAAIFNVLDETDMRPTQAVVESAFRLFIQFDSTAYNWNQLIATALPGLNTALQKTGLPMLDPNPANQSSTGPETAWEPLFAGSDLSDATFPTGVWSLVNGELTATEDQCIWTKKTYRDFVLDLEFKTADGTNSGVIVHCSDSDDWIPNSVEIQIADDYAPQWAKAPATWQCGAVFGHLAANKRTVKQPGAWNHYTITCKGREIWVELNGEQVNYMDMNRWISGSVNPDGSAIPSWLYKPFAALPLDGHIGLQGKHAGAPVWFRNIRIRPL